MPAPRHTAHDPGAPNWPAQTAWAALIVGFGGAMFAALALGLLALPFGGSLENPSPAVNILATLAHDAALVLAALLFARRVRRPQPADFGLRPVPIWPAAGWAALTMGAFVAFTAAWLALIGQPSSDSDLPNSLGANDSTVALIAVAVLVCVVAPLTEEFFFRGYFFGALTTWRGVWPAAIVTGLIFGAIHIGSSDPANLLPLAFFGFALCALRIITGSLYPSIAVHAFNNSLAFGATQDWGWQILPAALLSLAAVAGVLAVTHRQWQQTPSLP